VDFIEAEGKLRHYYDDYGDWVYTTTPEAALARATESRRLAELENGNTSKRLKLLREAIQFKCIAECLTLLGDQVPRPSVRTVSLADYRLQRNNEKGLQVTPDQIDDDDEVNIEYETYTMAELTLKALIPVYKRGDAAWTAAFNEQGLVEGYIPVIIVGLEIYPDEILYMVGHYDEIDDTVTTCFECVEAEDLFREMPASLDPYTKEKKCPKLFIVK
jgi:hypothetical protein